MKKTVILLFLIIMVMMSACAEKDNSSATGILMDMTVENIDETIRHMKEVHGTEFQKPDAFTIKYDSLSTLLLALRSGDVGHISLNSETAAFVMAQNDDLVAFDPTAGSHKTSFSMMTMADNKEVYDLINNAIIELKGDGTLDKIIEENLFAYREKEPKPSELPVIEGAETIVVAVTGDLPPLDYVSVDGKPAGFNVALLSAISERAGVNFEFSTVESGARITALSSGRVDVVFWSCASICAEHSHLLAQEAFENTLITEPYISLDSVIITIKE